MYILELIIGEWAVKMMGEGWRVKIMIFLYFAFGNYMCFMFFVTIKNNSGGWMFAYKNVVWKNTLMFLLEGEMRKSGKILVKISLNVNSRQLENVIISKGQGVYNEKPYTC